MILARFVPVLRAMVPVVAGVGRMPRRRYTAFNLAGALLWGVGMVVAGFLFGGFAFVSQHVELIMIGVVALSLLPASVAFLRRRMHARSAPPLADAATFAQVGSSASDD